MVIVATTGGIAYELMNERWSWASFASTVILICILSLLVNYLIDKRKSVMVSKSTKAQ